MNCLSEQTYKPQTRGHKARGYEVHAALWPVAAGFMPACFGFACLSGPAIHSHLIYKARLLVV
jgi:hypothetical protein